MIVEHVEYEPGPVDLRIDAAAREIGDCVAEIAALLARGRRGG